MTNNDEGINVNNNPSITTNRNINNEDVNQEDDTISTNVNNNQKKPKKKITASKSIVELCEDIATIKHWSDYQLYNIYLI